MKNDSVTGSSSSSNNSVNETSLFEETGDEIGSLAEHENENETNDEEVFNNLSEEYVINRKEELDKQLKEVKNQKHYLYKGLMESKYKKKREVKCKIRYKLSL